MRINTFLNSKINLLLSFLENLNLFLNLFLILRQFCLNIFYYKITIYIFFWIVLYTFIFKKTMKIFTFNFVNSFSEVINKICWWTWHKSRTINKCDLVRYSCNTFITIFINFCNFFFYWNRKHFLLSCIFHSTFKLLLELIC